ncbi:MAG TPA: tetratricopeptide repeat protein [Myxococcaceae bacterium]|nr:tetratricopeptide repeat protein [Myxococcaceae bacterium]
MPRLPPSYVLTLLVPSVVGCASDAASKSEVRTLQASVKQLQDDNLRLLERVQALETDRAVARAERQPLGPLLAAAPSTPTGSEVPTLAVVKLKPRVDRAPPIDVRTTVQEPDAELVAALARSPAPVAETPDATQLDGEFAQAQEALRTGNLGGGVERMTRFAEAHPKDPRADDALYLAALGELGQDEPGRAAKLLETALQRYPAGDLVQQAMLKLAECRMRLKQPAEARALLARLATSFPGTPAATEAQARLARIPRTP